LDLFMTGMDGFAILEKLRTSPSLKDIPVIVISGVDLDAKQREQLVNFGNKLLSKGTLDENELLALLDRSLSRLKPTRQDS